MRGREGNDNNLGDVMGRKIEREDGMMGMEGNEGKEGESESEVK